VGQLKIVTNSLGLLKDGWNNFGSVENAVEKTSRMLKMEKNVGSLLKKLWVCCKKLLKKLGSVEKAIEKTLGLLKRVLKKCLVY
jgi:hypothetical protein